MTVLEWYITIYVTCMYRWDKWNNIYIWNLCQSILNNPNSLETWRCSCVCCFIKCIITMAEMRWLQLFCNDLVQHPSEKMRSNVFEPLANALKCPELNFALVGIDLHSQNVLIGCCITSLMAQNLIMEVYEIVVVSHTDRPWHASSQLMWENWRVVV